MSPVSRGRKKSSARSGQRVLRSVPDVPQECDCPECSGAEFDPGAFITDLTAAAAEHLAVEDPLHVEMFGASLLGAGMLNVADVTEAFAGGIVPALEAESNTEALGVLLAIDAVHDGVGAADAARRLVGAGVTAPPWAGGLSEPVRAGVCRSFSDSAGEASMLLGSFERAGQSHAFLIHVNHLQCHEAADITLLPGDMIDEVARMIPADARRSGVQLTVAELEPGEFRWQAERALDARADHDQEDGEDGRADELDDEDEPGYPVLAVLLRARMKALPEPARPPAMHGSDPVVESLQMPAVSSVTGPPPKLPAKRKKSHGPAPIYQIKVSLRGAEPPIWRRLELAGDISLADLHHVIQTAFGWNGSHLHVFDTPYGSFGVADATMGHRAEKPVTLEQVATEVGNEVLYLYDFGDNWDHEVVVEGLLDRAETRYPRCVGGEGAAPPDDCGGLWGYADLVETLNDPTHPEHENMLDWLGLRSAAEFDPARFDAGTVTRALADHPRLRTGR